MQWNTLADWAADPNSQSQSHSVGKVIEGFPRVPAEYLSYNYRKEKQLEQIHKYKPDILCLQEVDHFSDFLEPTLEQAGYKGIFNRKLRTSDGVACFYRTEAFELVTSISLHLVSQLPASNTEQAIEAAAFVASSVASNVNNGTRNQPAIIAELRMRETKDSTDLGVRLSDKRLIVATTHFKAKHEFELLRAAQVRQLLAAISDFNKDKLPVILAGDLNSGPYGHVVADIKEAGYTSAYKFDGVMDVDIHDRVINTIYSSELTTYKYRKSKTGGPDEKITNRIDYIFYQGQGLTWNSNRALPSIVDIGENGLPNADIPSDHLPLVSSFAM